MIDFDSFFTPYKSIIEGTNNKYNFYKYIIPYLVQKNKPIFLLETGTMHSNYQGAFTYIMADLIKNYTGGKIYTIDISEEHMNLCKKFTEKFSDVIEYVLSDSLLYLNNLLLKDVQKFDLIYLDSYDLYVPDPIPSEKHHFKELLSIYTKLSNDCIVAIDDNYLPYTEIYWNWFNNDGSINRTETFYTNNTIIGKGRLCNEFLQNQGWKLIEEININGYSNTFTYKNT